MKTLVSSPRILIIAVAVCSLGVVFLLTWKWQAPEQPSSQVAQTESATPDPSTDPSPSSTNFTVPIRGGQDDSGTQPSGDSRLKSTATITITSEKPLTPIVEPETDPESLPPPPANTAPVLTTVLPETGTYQANTQDGSKNYRALTFSATATDSEDGAITDSASFHWSNLTANCSAAGADHCENEKDGNNFTMNIPVSGVCPGTHSIDLSQEYAFKVTVQDSEGLTDSREVGVTITYRCVADPISVPNITILSPMAIVYPGSSFDLALQSYSAILFNATATDNEDGPITDPNAFTWRLVSGECANVIGGVNLLCQAEKVGNNFTMDMLGACMSGTEYSLPYVYELSVRDSDGNIGTKQIAFAVTGDCSEQGN